MSFYTNYVRLCNQEGGSPSGVALKIGIEKSSVSRWAKGSVPRYSTLVKLADYFGVTVDDLMGDDEAGEDSGEDTTVEEAVEQSEASGLEAALEALRNQPGRRALLSATKNMTEAQVLRFADWLADITGGDKD
jgi:transcriptional regulator with XRE-family HTH domain